MVAIVVALSAVLLLSVAALAVDLGNAYARKRAVQSQADFAALAGAAKLPASGATGCPGTKPLATDLVVLQVVDYLNANQPQNDAGITAVTAGALVNCNLADGEVTYPDKNSVKVFAPKARVDYGLGKIMGIQNVNVQASATVQIESPGSGVMPTYAVSGCDYGPQTLTDPANGQATPTPVPALADNDTEINAVTLTGTSTNPTPVPVGASGYKVTLTAGKSQLQASSVSQVGFFRASGSAAPTLVTVSPPALTFAASGNTTTVTVTIPAAVTSVETAWYLRVRDSAASPQWSARIQAQPLRVGNPVLECSGTSSGGNFGSLKIPRTAADTTPSDWLSKNMAVGLQAPLSLAVYPSPAPDTCGPSPAVVSDAVNLRPGTNCVDTDTGLPANAATAGLITGTPMYVGRLDKGTTPGCGANLADRNARWDTTIGKGGSGNYFINDDLLTCFFINDTATIGSITQANYSGGAVLSEEIFRSPRFMWVPVLKVQPASGGSKKYSIIDFRPAFLGDQPLDATRLTNTLTTSTQHNGITISNNSILTMKVIFFDAKALPETADPSLPSGPYIGFGTKILRLTD